MKKENYEKTLENLSAAKRNTQNFFEKDIVKPNNENIKKILFYSFFCDVLEVKMSEIFPLFF